MNDIDKLSLDELRIECAKADGMGNLRFIKRWINLDGVLACDWPAILSSPPDYPRDNRAAMGLLSNLHAGGKITPLDCLYQARVVAKSARFDMAPADTHGFPPS